MRIAALLCVLFAFAGSAAASTRPVLQLAETPELVVRGAGFAKFEPLKVTAFVRGGTAIRRVTATRLGRFTLRFDLRRETCPALHLVQAVGPKSGLVRLRLPLRECAELQIP